MTKRVHGVVHGKTIELTEELGVADGQQVELDVRLVPVTTQWGDGLRRCAGALAGEWTEEDDRILAEIHEARKRDVRRDLPE